MKLNAREKKPWVRHDWSPKLLGQVQRWANRRIWRVAPFDQYDSSVKSRPTKPASDCGLFQMEAS